MTNAWAMRPLKPALIASSFTAAGFDPLNMLNDYAGIVWKTTSQTGITFDIDMGSAVSLDAFLFFGCTGASTSWTMAISAADNSLSTSGAVAVASGVPFLAGADFPSHGRGVGYWDAGSAVIAAKRYWRITIQNLGPGVVTIARLAIGQRLLLERNFAFGGGWGLRDLGQVEFSPTGVLVRRRAAKLRTLGLTFPNVRKDEVEAKIQPLIELNAGQEPIVIVTDPAADAKRQLRCWMGWMIGDLGTIWRSPSGWEWRANLIDMIPIPKSSG
jgi:hypothetical protein